MFCTGKLFNIFITLLFIIFYNHDSINYVKIGLLFVRQIFFSAIAPVISFFLEMVNFNFKILDCLLF